MGLISFLKNKFKKKDESVDTYSQGMEKSRQNFSNKLTNLSNRYKTVNQEYFEELEQILIESDVGINLTLKIIDEVLEQSRLEKITEPTKINEILVDKMFVVVLPTPLTPTTSKTVGVPSLKEISLTISPLEA